MCVFCRLSKACGGICPARISYPIVQNVQGISCAQMGSGPYHHYLRATDGTQNRETLGGCLIETEQMQEQEQAPESNMLIDPQPGLRLQPLKPTFITTDQGF